MSVPLLAFAGPFTVTAGYNLGTSSSAGLTDVPPGPCSSSGLDALEFTGSGSNNIGIHTYGCGLGQFQFGSRSSGEGTYFVDGHVNYSDTFTGTDFSFTVSPGHTGAWGSPGFASGEFQQGSMRLLLTIDSVTYMDESFSVRVDSTGTTASHGGTVQLLSFTPVSGTSSFDYIVNALNDTINGLADTSHTVSYDIFTEASGNITATSSCLAPVSQGGGGYNQPTAFGGVGPSNFAVYCGAGAQTGDPLPPFPRAVPEPGSGALVALGAAAMAIANLRRRKKKLQS
jgi:hypothetical protein